MAQDFRAAFGLGDSDKAIVLTDVAGIALAAIQGLNVRLQERDAEAVVQREEIARLRDEVVRQRAELASLRTTQDDVAALRAVMTELLRERTGSTVRTRLDP
jgi:hypothetical protein